MLVFNPHIDVGEDDNIIYRCSQKINGIPMIRRELDPDTFVALSTLPYAPEPEVTEYIKQKLSRLALEANGEMLRKAFENPHQPLCRNCMNCPLEYIKQFHSAITV